MASLNPLLPIDNSLSSRLRRSPLLSSPEHERRPFAAQVGPDGKNDLQAPTCPHLIVLLIPLFLVI